MKGAKTMKDLKYYSHKMFDLSVNIEKIYSLAGDITTNDEIESLVSINPKEVKKAIKLKFKDYSEFCESVNDYEKYGLLAEISQLEFERKSEICYSSTGVRAITIIYAETYEELLNKIIEYSEKYHNKLAKKSGGAK